MLSADDLKVFLEVARRGRLTEAAKHLHVSHTTVGRHINRLERSTENRLFDRTAEGWTLTDAGSRLMQHAEAVESALIAAQEDCYLQEATVAGSVRLLTPDGFGAYLLLPGLGPLRRQHGNLVIELVTTNRHSSLTPREFDLAVTIERPDARAVSVSKLASYNMELYASPEYLHEASKIDSTEDLKKHSLIWYVEEALDPITFDLLRKLHPDAHAVIQCNNISGHIQAAEMGLGIAFLPSYIADKNQRLHRVFSTTSNVVSSYWLSTPKDLSRLPRVRIMTTFLEQLVSNNIFRFNPSINDLTSTSPPVGSDIDSAGGK